MNLRLHHGWRPDAAGGNPDAAILLVPYMWIGDFVRCHTVVKLLKQRFPSRPIDVLTTAMASPLLDYMPGVRKGIIVDLPRRRLALGQHHALAGRLRREAYGQALVMPRTWKAALALYLAGIPQRTGFVGEGRFGLINDLRWGERRLPRMVERCAVLALPKGESPPGEWPLPELVASGPEVAAWRQRLGLARRSAPRDRAGARSGRPCQALAHRLLCGSRPPPGCRGPSRLGGRGTERKPARRRDCGSRPRCRPGPDRPRSAQCHSGAGGSGRRGLQRFRPAARGRRPRHAGHRHFRPYQPVALGAAQSTGCRDRGAECSRPAGPATCRFAGSAIIFACATSRWSRCWRRRAPRSWPPRFPPDLIG